MTSSKIILTSLLCFTLSGIGRSYSQTDSLPVAIADSAAKSAAVKKHNLFVSTAFGSNMIFLGSSISSNNPYYGAGLVYGYKGSFFLSASATHIRDIEPFGAFFSAAADYKHTFNKWFDVAAEVAGYKTDFRRREKLFSDFTYAGFTAGFDWKILYTRITSSLIYSGETKGYLQISNSRYFQTPYFLKKKAYVSFFPEINLLMGQLVKVDDDSGNPIQGYMPPFFRQRPDQPLPLITVSTRFAPVYLNFSSPVTFSYKGFSLEADPCYILPTFKDNMIKPPKGFTFYMTATFRIF